MYLNLNYDDSMCREITKSQWYVSDCKNDPFRLQEDGSTLRLQGDNHLHTLTPTINGIHYDCDCNFYQARGICSHTMTLEKLEICPMRHPDRDRKREASRNPFRLYNMPAVNSELAA